MKFKIGDKVRVKVGHNGYAKESPWVRLTSVVCGEYDGYVRVMPLNVEHENSIIKFYAAATRLGSMAGFSESGLELVEEAMPNRESTAMSYAEAAQQLQRIKDAGIQVSAVRMEPRSWDNEARFAALIVNGQRLRYKAEVDAFILSHQRRFEKAYVLGNPKNLCTVESARGKHLFAPDGSRVWSPREVRDNLTFVRDNVEYTLMVKVTEVPIKVALDNDLIK